MTETADRRSARSVAVGAWGHTKDEQGSGRAGVRELSEQETPHIRIDPHQEHAHRHHGHKPHRDEAWQPGRRQ